MASVSKSSADFYYEILLPTEILVKYVLGTFCTNSQGSGNDDIFSHCHWTILIEIMKQLHEILRKLPLIGRKCFCKDFGNK